MHLNSSLNHACANLLAAVSEGTVRVGSCGKPSGQWAQGKTWGAFQPVNQQSSPPAVPLLLHWTWTWILPKKLTDCVHLRSLAKTARLLEFEDKLSASKQLSIKKLALYLFIYLLWTIRCIVHSVYRASFETQLLWGHGNSCYLKPYRKKVHFGATLVLIKSL